MGPLSRASRRLRDRQTGALPRLRRVAGVFRATIRDRGPWRSLPEAIANALLAPVRHSAPAASPRPPRDWAPERAAAATRLAATATRLAKVAPRDIRVAAIADASDLGAITVACHATAVRPEDWAMVLAAASASGAAPDLLLVTSARNGNGGAWTYRIGWYAHPDSFLHRDLRALVEWCAERGIPSVFAARDEPDVVRDFGDAAALFDLVLAANEATAEDLRDLPARHGAGIRVPSSGADLRAALASVPELFAPAGDAKPA